MRTNDYRCPVIDKENPAYDNLTRDECKIKCLTDHNCMAYRWYVQQIDQGTSFKSCHVWSWTEQDKCKKIHQCWDLTGIEEESCFNEKDARIFIKSDKCNLNISVYHFHIFYLRFVSLNI